MNNHINNTASTFVETIVDSLYIQSLISVLSKNPISSNTIKKLSRLLVNSEQFDLIQIKLDMKNDVPVLLDCASKNTLNEHFNKNNIGLNDISTLKEIIQSLPKQYEEQQSNTKIRFF